MKNKAKVLSVALFLSAFIMVISFGGQRAEWKGKIEIEDGVKVIKNPAEPLFGKIEFELVEDLSIGKEDDENYLFYRVRDIEVDRQGSIYVADMSNYRIQKFDRSGNYIQTFGRQGQGPGEFELPTKIRISETTGNIYVKDQAYGIEIFDKHGTHIKGFQIKKSFSDFRLDEDGNIIGIFRTGSDLNYTNSVCKVNLQGEIVETYAEFPYNQYARRSPRGGIVTSTTGWEKKSLISKINNQIFVYGYSEKYDLSVIDKNGQLLYKITKEEPFRKFPAAKRRRLKEMNLGDFQPFYYSIFSDNKGRIYVQTNKTWREEDVKLKEVDIFSKDGYFLYKTTLP
ncbi:MAG: 6-bladed beta-propeller, partial [Candidatus Aminicenantes bacterium]|nr:6-bladed beta-propeller [Candidatus Aminicenantes bacterium]